MRIMILILFIFGLIFNSCEHSSESDLFVKGPYLQNVKTDGITILWESKTPSPSKIEFGKTRELGTEIFEKDLNTIHELTLIGLETETTYYYRTWIGDAKSKIFTFKTAVHKTSPFSFVFYGDNKNGPHIHERNANLILTKKPEFVIHNGDLVDEGTIYKQWNLLFFNPTRNLLHTIPLYPVLGNHERHAKYYFNYFSLPGIESWYSFDYGNAHFIMLDSDANELTAGSEQLAWLIDDLEHDSANWTFVSFHYPPFTAGGNYYRKSRIKLKNLIHPVMEKYGVDMVFGGHDHNYERSYPIMSRSGKTPVTYIVAGNGGTSMRYIGEREWTHYAERVFGFAMININGPKLHLQAYSIDDKVIDELILDKSDPKSVAAYQEHTVYFEDIYDPVDATKLYKEGDDLLDEEKYAKALTYFLNAYESDSTCIEALVAAAECFIELGNSAVAMDYAMKGIEKKPNYPDSYEVLIDVYKIQKKYEDALFWAARWLEIEPDSPDPNQAMADIYTDQGKYDIAIIEMNRAVNIVPSDPGLYIELGKLYEKVGDQNNALTAYQNALYWHRGNELEDDFIKARDKIQKWSNRNN